MSKKIRAEKTEITILLFSVFVIAGCAIIYELIIATISSYLLGNSVYQFSLTIGLFMSSMGLGSYLSKFVKSHLIDKFIQIEIAIALVGGFSSFILFSAFTLIRIYTVVMILLIIVIGMLIGLEIPILMRIVRQHDALPIALANVLSFDYIGGLIGSLAFPLLLLPHFGLMNSAFFVGGTNIVIALINLKFYRHELTNFNRSIIISIVSVVVLIGGLAFGNPIQNYLEARFYQDRVVFSKQSKYQRIVLTKWKNDLRLFINGNIQFSSIDEYRYHESLVHFAMGLVPFRENVLILGGGDGLAAREILKYRDVQKITIVDIDPVVTDLCRSNPQIKQINNNSLSNSKVEIINADAKKFLENTDQLFDLIFVDLPDPNSPELAQLYAKEFYILMRRQIAEHGVIVTQSSSPFFAREAFWCIHRTIESADLSVVPYHVNVPSFGDWGFNLASKKKIDLRDRINFNFNFKMRFLTSEIAARALIFGRDVEEIDVKINTLIEPNLIDYYQKGWSKWSP